MNWIFNWIENKSQYLLLLQDDDAIIIYLTWTVRWHCFDRWTCKQCGLYNAMRCFRYQPTLLGADVVLTGRVINNRYAEGVMSLSWLTHRCHSFDRCTGHRRLPSTHAVHNRYPCSHLDTCTHTYTTHLCYPTWRTFMAHHTKKIATENKENNYGAPWKEHSYGTRHKDDSYGTQIKQLWYTMKET